jgi:hypothetical protein
LFVSVGRKAIADNRFAMRLNKNIQSGKSLTSGLPAHRALHWQTIGVSIFLAVIIFAIYGQTLRYGFVNYDDEKYVYENPVVSAGLTLKGMAWAFGSYHLANWVPLTLISHMLDCQLYQLAPGGHHLTNILLHTASAIILFLVLGRMTGTLWPGAFVAAIFAIHPLHVESVAWVSERKDVLSGLFFMLTLWMYCRYANKPSFPGLSRGDPFLCARFDVQTNARDLAAYFIAARLLAAEPLRKNAGSCCRFQPSVLVEERLHPIRFD